MSLTIRPINTGYVTTIPKQYLYHHSTVPFLSHVSDDRIEMPCFTFLVEGGDKLTLVDTGMAWTERASKYHHPGSRQPEGMSIISQLEKIGYKPEDIENVIFSHLHWDHMYYMDKFINAEFYVHEKEYAFAKDPIPLYYKSYEHPSLGLTPPFEGIKMHTVTGETEIMKGVRVFETPGHSPGHQCVEIDTREGSYICCGDAVFILDNFNSIPEIHYDITPPGRYANIIDSWRSIQKIKSRVARYDLLLPCHEAALLERTKNTPILGL